MGRKLSKTKRHFGLIPSPALLYKNLLNTFFIGSAFIPVRLSISNSIVISSWSKLLVNNIDIAYSP